MVRVLAVAVLVLLASFSRSSIEDYARPGLIEHRAVGIDPTTRASDAVRARFTLDAEVARCSVSENLYAYRALLDRFSDAGRKQLEAAAEAGREAGRAGGYGPRAPQSDQACAASVDGLRAADDELLALSESLTRN